MKKNITVAVQKISPAFAKNLLETKSVGNRKIDVNRVKQYASDMKSGRWTLSDSAIWFDEDGHIVNGHHRLLAIVESGSTQTFVMVTGVSKEDVINADTGRVRSAQDAGYYAGVHVPKRQVTILRAMVNYSAGVPVRLSMSRLMELLNENKERILFVDKSVGANIKGITCGPVLAACALAFDHVSPNSLKEFMLQLTKGAGSDGTSNLMIRRLQRDLLLDGGRYTSLDRIKQTHKTCAAIDAFARDSTIARFPNVKSEKYFLGAQVKINKELAMEAQS